VLLDSLDNINNEMTCGGPLSPVLYYIRIAFPVGNKDSTYNFNFLTSFDAGFVKVDGYYGLEAIDYQGHDQWSATVNQVFDVGMHYIELYGMVDGAAHDNNLPFSVFFTVGIEGMVGIEMPVNEANLNVYKEPIDTAPNSTTSVNITVVDGEEGSTSYNLTLDCALWFDGENDYVSVPGPKATSYNDDLCI
jgi:hypothetical protein